MQKSILIGLVVLAVAGGGTAYAIGSETQDRSAVTAQQRQATFVVDNMTCATCPITVKKAMEGVAGVSEVTINFAGKTARATYDPARTSAAAIAAASTDAGYPARAAT